MNQFQDINASLLKLSVDEFSVWTAPDLPESNQLNKRA